MTPALAIYTKELKGQFYSLTAYVFTGVFLVSNLWLFFQNFFLFSQANLRSFFELLPWFLLLLVPALTMRTWAEEKRQGTAELLLTLPIFEWQQVLAKFLANFTFLGFTLALSLGLPITVARIGDLDWGPVVGGYLGAWLFGGAYLALGQWISSLTSNQIGAFLPTAATAFALIIIGLPVALLNAGPLTEVLYRISTVTHYFNLAKGVVDVRDAVYFTSFITLFLYLNVYSLVRRHWK